MNKVADGGVVRASSRSRCVVAQRSSMHDASSSHSERRPPINERTHSEKDADLRSNHALLLDSFCSWGLRSCTCDRPS
jgi:hypothetical protein